MNIKDKIFSILLILLVLLISIKADGRFPFPDSLSILQFQLLLFIFFLIPFLFIILSILFDNYFFNLIPQKINIFLEKISFYNLTISTGIIFEVLILIILLLSNKKYSEFGYSLNTPLVIAVFGIIIACFLLFLKFKIKINYLLGFIISIYILVYFLSIIYFPLHPKKSDMLPLILSACKNFLNVQSPYSFHFIPHKLPLTYLPGLWLSFLPAAFFDFDLRFINLFFTVSSMLILLTIVKNQDQSKLVLFITIFLLNPYLQYRHEIYLGVYLFSLSTAYILLHKGNLYLASIVFGWSMTISQFSWIMFPFLLIYYYKNFRFKKGIYFAAITFLIFILIVSPFIFWSPNHFYYGIIKHWEDLYNINLFRETMKTINLSYFLSFFISPKYFKIVQILILLSLYLISFNKIGSLKSCLKWMALALLAFILLNQLIWVYFYLTIIILLIFFNLSSANKKSVRNES